MENVFFCGHKIFSLFCLESPNLLNYSFKTNSKQSLSTIKTLIIKLSKRFIMEYWLIEVFLIVWMVLTTILTHKLINKYPLGLSRKQAEINSLRALFYLTVSLVLCGLIYFSAWVANWSSRLAIPISSSSIYSVSQLADLISTINLTLSGSVISLAFTQQKRNLSAYQNLFGLADILPNHSLKVISSLPINKQAALAERLSWVVERVEKNDPFKLTILFDKDELNVLAKIFTNIDIEKLDSRLVPIYQEVNRLSANPKPFSIIL
jgi:hypothetical protein